MVSPVVAVYGIDLAITTDEAGRLADDLSDAERQRADRLRFDHHGLLFIAARAGLRQRLAECLGERPARLRLEAPEFEKPFLPDYPQCHFNLTHSGTLALVAVTDFGPVGVDVERIRTLEDMDGVARRVFTPGEQRALRGAASADRARAFFNGWTRKEALIKATGEGFRADLSRIGVTLAPDATPAVTHWPTEDTAAPPWQLAAFVPRPGYVAAVACRGTAAPRLVLKGLPHATGSAC